MLTQTDEASGSTWLGEPHHYSSAPTWPSCPNRHSAAPSTLKAARCCVRQRRKVFPIECVARGYLAGSGLEGVRAPTGHVCGVPLPPRRFAGGRPPARAALHPRHQGRDRGRTTRTCSFEVMSATASAGRDAEELKLRTLLDIYRPRRTTTPSSAGSSIADTKFEFGVLPGGRRDHPDRRGADPRQLAGSGRLDSSHEPGRSRARRSTSSSCATGSFAAAGTGRGRRRRYRRTWWRQRRGGTRRR